MHVAFLTDCVNVLKLHVISKEEDVKEVEAIKSGCNTVKEKDSGLYTWGDSRSDAALFLMPQVTNLRRHGDQIIHFSFVTFSIYRTFIFTISHRSWQDIFFGSKWAI